MNGLSNAHHFRKTVAGICMVVAPLLLLIALIVHPETGTSERSIVAAAAGDPDAWYAAHAVALASLALAVPATLGLMHMLRERAVAWGHVGGGLTLLGLMAFVGIVAVDGFVGWQAGSGDRAEMVALLERLYESAGYLVPFVVMSFGFVLGMLALVAGLLRAQAVSPITAGCIAVGALLLTIAGPTASEWVGIAGAAVFAIGLGTVGRTVLAESDEEWEHTPQHGGFKPLAGTR